MVSIVFDGALGGAYIFIYVVFMVIHGVMLTIRWLCELDGVAGVLIVFVVFVGGMSWWVL